MRLLGQGVFDLLDPSTCCRRIDPDRGRQRPRLRQPVREPLRVLRERLGEHERPLLALRRGEPVVHVVRREQAEPDVVVLGVVPGEEVAAEAARVLERAEAVGEVGPVLQRLELRLGVRVVVRDVRPRVALGDAEVGEQQRDRLRGHRRAAVGVHGELARRDALPLAALGDQLLGEPRGLAVRPPSSPPRSG